MEIVGLANDRRCCTDANLLGEGWPAVGTSGGIAARRGLKASASKNAHSAASIRLMVRLDEAPFFARGTKGSFSSLSIQTTYSVLL